MSITASVPRPGFAILLIVFANEIRMRSFSQEFSKISAGLCIQVFLAITGSVSRDPWAKVWSNASVQREDLSTKDAIALIDS